MTGVGERAGRPAAGTVKEGGIERAALFSGVELVYLPPGRAPLRTLRDSGEEYTLYINYCRSGCAECGTGDGVRFLLRAGDFSLHTAKSCRGFRVSLPDGEYSGLALCVDTAELCRRPPQLLRDLSVPPRALAQGLCSCGGVSFFAGSERSQGIFSGFYGAPAHLADAYRKLKALELLLYLCETERGPHGRLAACRSEQVDIARRAHDRLTDRMNERITIEELARCYHINPTTLKAAFKAVYGNSIAAHIKEHRMERAAELLQETSRSVAEIAQEVGYDSQSRFSAAFKAAFGVLPKDYRKG